MRIVSMSIGRYLMRAFAAFTPPEPALSHATNSSVLVSRASSSGLDLAKAMRLATTDAARVVFLMGGAGCL